MSSDHNPVALPQEVLEENILVKLLSTSLSLFILRPFSVTAQNLRGPLQCQASPVSK